MSAYIQSPISKYFPSLPSQHRPIYIPPNSRLFQLFHSNDVPAAAANFSPDPAFAQDLRQGGALKCICAMLRTPVGIAFLLAVVTFVAVVVLTVVIKMMLVEEKGHEWEMIVVDDVEKNVGYMKKGGQGLQRPVMRRMSGVVRGLKVMGMGEDLIDVEVGDEKKASWEDYKDFGLQWT